MEAERDKLREALSLYDDVPERPGIGLGNHMADDGTEAFDQAANLALRRNQEALLAQVEMALARMDAGTYGLCERCGEPIDYARLKAIPYATLCIECQTHTER